MKNSYKLLAAVLLAAIICLAAGCGSNKVEEDKMAHTVADGYVMAEEATEYVDLLMDSGRHIVIRLDPDTAPVTVANFQKLVGESFYDGIIFHRIVKNFMIQGGDPTGTGRGGSKENIKGEFLSNGVDNRLSHERGVVSMARTPLPDSASSQFFICHGDSQFLDGDYAAFGRVVYGMEEVDRIASLATGTGDVPQTAPVMERVFFVKPQP